MAFAVNSILIFLLSNSILFSQNEVNSIIVNPLNRLKISFDKSPSSFDSELSSDKKIITLKINEQFNYIDTTLKFGGIISQVAIRSAQDTLIIIINLNDRRGYTVSKIPYSNSLIIDVFQWNNLSDGEDKFRTALIALESNFPDAAHTDLIESIKKDTKEAAAILGLDLLKSSYIQSSKKLFEFCIFKGDTSIYEIYAGLSDIYNSIGDKQKSNEFSEKYLLISKAKRLDFIIYGKSNPLDSAFLVSLAFLDSLMPISKIDSTKLLAKDTTNSFKVDSSDKKDLIFDSVIIEYAIYLLLAILLLIIYFYVKWRNQKINNLINNKKIKIPESNKDAKVNEESTPKDVQKKPLNKKLANIYKNKISEEDNSPKQEVKKTQFEKMTEQSEKSKTLLDIVKKVQDENKKADKKEQIAIEQELISNRRLPAKIEIAMNIAQEQKRIKEQSLEEFNELSFPTDKEKLSEISKKLGIEMSGFEIRKQIDKIMKSDKEMEDMKNKFTNRAE